MTVLPPNLQSNNFQKKSSLEDELEIEKTRMQIGTEEMQEELKEAWDHEYANAPIFSDKFATSSHEVIDFLLSYQNTLFYNDVARKFNLNQKQRDTLPQIIWQVCLNKKWEQLGALIQNNLSVGLPIAEQIATSLNQNIILKARELSQQSFAASGFQTEPTENRNMPLNLNDALKQYPEIGEQLITSEHISLKNFPEPVRPSIKNWLADYTFTLGYEKHSSVERNNYIFHSNNSLHLSSADRQKLAYILKAHDDGSPVTVNGSLKQIIFPAISSEPRVVPVAPRETSVPPARVTPDTNHEAARPISPRPTFRQTQRPAQEFSPRAQSLQSANLHQGTFFHNDTPPQTTNTPARPVEDSAKPAHTDEQKTPTANISFSSAQKLPYEKIYPVKSLSQQGATDSQFNGVNPVKSDGVGAQQFNKANSSELAPQQSAVNPRFNKIAPAKPMSQQSAMETQPDEEKPHSFVIRPVFSHPEQKTPARNASRSDAGGEPKPLPKNVINLKEV